MFGYCGGNKMRKRIVVAVVLAVLLVASAYAQTADFFELAKTGTPQSVQAAIDSGADIKARDSLYGMNALMNAARSNPNPEVITALLKAGADLKTQSNEGFTALMYAARKNQNPEVIATL